MCKLKIRNDRYVRLISKGKKTSYLNISIPKKIAESLDLQYKNFVKLYLDNKKQYFKTLFYKDFKLIIFDSTICMYILC